MSYRGVPDVRGFPELTSVRRMRESGMFKLPDGSGFFTGTVGKKKEAGDTCPTCGSPLNPSGECNECMASQEGGPGSGPQGGRGQKRTTPEMAKKAGGGVKSTADKGKTLQDHFIAIQNDGDPHDDDFKAMYQQAKKEGNTKVAKAVLAAAEANERLNQAHENYGSEDKPNELEHAEDKFDGAMHKLKQAVKGAGGVKPTGYQHRHQQWPSEKPQVVDPRSRSQWPKEDDEKESQEGGPGSGPRKGGGMTGAPGGTTGGTHERNKTQTQHSNSLSSALQKVAGAKTVGTTEDGFTIHKIPDYNAGERGNRMAPFDKIHTHPDGRWKIMIDGDEEAKGSGVKSLGRALYETGTLPHKEAMGIAKSGK